MEWTEPFLGSDEHTLTWWQVGIRTFVMFIVAWILIRIAGVRTFGKRSAIDIITLFMLGSILARSIVGPAPFLPSILAGAILVTVHRLISIIVYHNKRFGELIKGKNVVFFENGKFFPDRMRRYKITEEEVQESVRRCLNSEDMSDVERIYFEPSGRISVIRKQA